MIRLGDRGPHVREWRRVMALRFAGYERIHGDLPPGDEYGPRAVSWQKEYESRTYQMEDGIVSDADLASLGVNPTPPPAGRTKWLFTVHGTAMADPLGPGLPADTARAVLDKYTWQPIGNYPAAAFPMWPSVQQGVKELVSQISSKPGEINLAGYSQGAIVIGQVLKHRIMNAQGDLHHRLGDVRKVVFWGNPMRQQGIAADDRWIHAVARPEQHGILDDRLEGLENAPFEVRDYGHAADMFAAISEGDRDEYKIAICKIVMNATDFFNGPNSVVSQLTELGERPLQEGIAMAMAVIDTLKFFTSTAHGYNIGPAIEFLRG